MTANVPLILLSGMAADERLFAPQRQAFPHLIVPRWIEPLEKESIPSYARRLAKQTNPRSGCFVGGASFGGIVALEMARHLDAKACFLICSVRSPRELPLWIRLMRPAALLGPSHLGVVAKLAAHGSAATLPRQDLRRLKQLGRPEAAFLRWATWAVLRWHPDPKALGIPVWQIHGSNDRTLPIENTRPDVVVSGGGHLLPVTHGRAVNAFLQERMAFANSPA
jgi:pimeloyl-ACP methyl ester carboxylesterase